MTELVSQCELVPAELLDKHAPIITKQVTVCPLAPWYNSKINDAKRERQCLERKYKQTGLSIHYDRYFSQCIKFNYQLFESSRSHYNRIIANHPNDQKKIFQVFNKVANTKGESPLPNYDSLQHIF